MPARSAVLINRAYPPYPGETGRLTRDLAHALARDGWTVRIVCAGDQDLDHTDGPVQVLRRRAIGQRTLDLHPPLRAIARLLNTLPPTDVAVTLTDPPLLPLVSEAVHGRFGRWVHWCQDVYPDLLPWVGIPASPAQQAAWSARMARAMDAHATVVVIGDCMKRALIDRGVDPGKVHVLPNWPRLTTTAAWDRPCSKGKLRIAYSGSLTGVHGVATIGRLLIKLKAELPNDDIAAYLSDRDQSHLKAALSPFPTPLWPAIRPAVRMDRLRRHLAEIDLQLAAIAEGASGLLLPSKIGQALAGGRRVLYIGPRESDAAGLVTRAGGSNRLAFAPSDVAAIPIDAMRASAAEPPPRPFDPGANSLARLVSLVADTQGDRFGQWAPPQMDDRVHG